MIVLAEGRCVFWFEKVYISTELVSLKKKKMEIYVAELNTKASKWITIAYMEVLQAILINS